MKTVRNLLAVILLTTGAIANATTTFDFVSMANNPPGEKGFSVLSLSGAGFNLDITGTMGGLDAFAYLDSGHGGLGVCGTLTAVTFQCTPSSDDDVTTGDVLSLLFDQAVTIDSIWFNNNHDGDGTLSGNKISIGGTDYSLVSALGVPSFDDDWTPNQSFYVPAGQALLITLATSDADQFYVSGMTVTAAIPEPETYAMLLAGLGLMGFVARRRRKAQAA